MIDARCDICGGPSNGYECDWEVTGWVETPISAVSIGDTIRRVKQARETSSVAKVAMIELLDSGFFAITLAIQTPKSLARYEARSALLAKGPLHFDDEAGLLQQWKAERFKKFWPADDHVTLSVRPHACRNKVCDACMIERDPERMVICAAHWMEWEKVA